MAAGDTSIMARYVELITKAGTVPDWDTNTIKIAFVTSTLTPSKTDSDPCWGAGGTQNYSTNEVTPGGNYAAGGVTISGCTVTNSAGVVKLNATSPLAVAANAANPTNARWGIVYDSTITAKNVIGFIDLGGVVSLVPGLNINLNGTGSGTQPVFQATV